MVVLDGVGIGALPDAARYGDEGSDSLGNVIRRRGRLDVRTLMHLGLCRLVAWPEGETAAVVGAYGRMASAGAGKDTTAGHWELAGVVLEQPFPLFPRGFPPEAVAALERATGRRMLGNRAASGTQIIAELGAEHLATGALILYTSADSVCQLAAHVAVVPPAELYRMGAAAREVMTGAWGVGRVIVRPFEGEAGAFRRLNEARRDFSLPPPAPTLLDRLSEKGYEVRGLGKVEDTFAGRGFTRCEPTRDNDDGARKLVAALSEKFTGLLMINLNDTDTVYGHRNDVEGYARALERVDAALPAVLDALNAEDLLLIVSDHGNDPTTPSTDHSREYTPLLVYHRRLRREIPLGTRATMADVAQTAAANFGLPAFGAGTSFLDVVAA